MRSLWCFDSMTLSEEATAQNEPGFSICITVAKTSAAEADLLLSGPKTSNFGRKKWI
jgi:hypothetical protein